MLTKESLLFMADLRQNNNKEWFATNKKRYETYKKDYHQLVSEFLVVLKELDPSLSALEVKNCVFRINRDIRFSNDKSPYKTNMGLWFSSGVKRQNRAGYYVHIEEDACFIAGGLYSPDADELKKVRKEIAYFSEDLTQILNEKKFKEVYGDIATENSLKNPPKGYEKEHEAIKYLKLKNFVATSKFNTSMVFEDDFVSNIANKLVILKPLNDFINRALDTE